ncbi:MAG: beta-lactamase family protein [Clostridia bacterium]|nr:beta-lactamase family protein [Clostridia bacterium]
MKNIQAMLDAALVRGRETGCFPAAAAAVGIRDTVLARSFTGEAPLPGDEPVNEHTRFDMASLSKVLGPTMIALKALEAGTLRLEDKVGDFFPDAPADKRDITVFMLMTHTGGFHPSFRLDRMGICPEDVAQAILDYPLTEKPGTRPIYSCMGYILLTKCLERRFGQPLDALARDRVFMPLGMTETGYCPPADAVCAATEVDPETGKPWIGIVHDENARFQGGVSGNAGVFMPLTDGIRFAKMLANMGDGYLRCETMEKAIHNYTPGQEQHRGLGFHLAGTPDCFFSSAVPDACFGHTGFTGTSLLVEPGTGFWMLLLTNRVYPTRDTSLLFPFRRDLHATMWKAVTQRDG